jgi:hypothetical protein
MNRTQLKEMIKTIVREEKSKKMQESLEDLDTTLPAGVSRYLDKVAAVIKSYNLPRKKEIMVLATIIDALGMDKGDITRDLQKIKSSDILNKK